MRNEAQNIGRLLDDCVRQKYPRDFFRIIVIDDHSTDGSDAVVKAFSEKYPNIFLLSLPAGKCGKKAALHHALPHLTEELAVTTDADCRLPAHWLSTIAAYYESCRPVMMICPVVFSREQSFFGRLQALEMMSIVGSTAGAAAKNHPVMSSGANLAIRRDVMERHAYIYDEPPASGDDMMMMLEIKKKYPNRIKYLKSTDATVETTPQPTLSSFIRQRSRWTSKSSKYTDKDTIIVALIVFFANFAIVACAITGFFYPKYFLAAAVLWAIKFLADFPFLYSLTRFWNRKELMRVFLPTQLLYPFYVVFVAFSGNILPVRWKGRKNAK